MNTLRRVFCRKRASFLLSLAFHSLLFGGILYFTLQESPKKPEPKEEPKKALAMVMYNLQTPPPKKMLPPEPPKPVAPPKPKKPEPKPKRTVPLKKVEPKPQPKPEPKPVELPKEPIVMQAPPIVTPQQIVAKEPTPPPPPQKTPQELSKEYAEVNFSGIRDMALKHLIYPRVAEKMGWKGVVEIKLVVGTDGKLIEATVHKSSGKEILDKSALKAALALKDELLPKPQSRSEIILPIAFRMR